MNGAPPGGAPSGGAGPVDGAALRRHPLFEGLGEDDLARLLGLASVRAVDAGDVLMRQGDAGDTMYLLLDGELEVSQRDAAGERRIATRAAGEVIGEMAVLERAPRSATVRALRPSRLLVIDQAAFATLLSCSDTAATTILRTVTGRLRHVEALLMQREKLAALGTLAAGLAHELNNPAGAVLRGSAQLGDALEALDEAAAALSRLPLGAEAASALRAPDPGSPTRPARVDPLELGEREDAMEAWLRAVGVAGALEIAPALVARGWTTDELEARTAALEQAHRPAVLTWLGAMAAARALVDDAGSAAAAIAEIVGSVKRYAYLDQAPVQRVDVHEGLESTLVMLRHELRDGVRVVRAYAPDLPRIDAYGSELNQVWTNLIDNATSAMGGRGVLTLRTSANEREVTVEVEDDGPGIPSDVLPRVFEPFFTTKAVGSGTGLGLHIAYTIVVHRHRGTIQVASHPGSTRFTVTLPRTGDETA